MSSATERVDPRCCQSCRTTEASCDSKRLFRSARCCDNCDHDNAVVAFEQHKGYILTVWSVVLLDESTSGLSTSPSAIRSLRT